MNRAPASRFSPGGDTNAKYSTAHSAAHASTLSAISSSFFVFIYQKSPSVFCLLSAEGPICMLYYRLKIEAEAYAAHVRGLFGKLGYGEIVHVNNKILAVPAFKQGVF